MILTIEQLEQLRNKTKQELLMLLYEIEDDLDYNCKEVSDTLNYLQKD